MHIYSNLDIIYFSQTVQGGEQMSFLNGVPRKRKQESRSQVLKGGSFQVPSRQEGFLGPGRHETDQRVRGIHMGRVKNRTRKQKLAKRCWWDRQCSSEEQPSQSTRSQGGCPGKAPIFCQPAPTHPPYHNCPRSWFAISPTL